MYLIIYFLHSPNDLYRSLYGQSYSYLFIYLFVYYTLLFTCMQVYSLKDYVLLLPYVFISVCLSIALKSCILNHISLNFW